MEYYNDDDPLWTEKYRPRKIDDCILPAKLKSAFKKYIECNKLTQNLILAGRPGIGKTTVARALCDEIGAEVLLINGSKEGRHIDTLDTTITSFATTVSIISEGQKVSIIDEADYMNAQSIQPALRRFIEETSGNCKFIFTCNHENRLISALHSRCAKVYFKVENSEKPIIMTEFFKRIEFILKNEGVDYDKAVIANVIKKFFPDFRKILNELQLYSASGKIDSGLLVNTTKEEFTQLIGFMKNKDLASVHKWVTKNSDMDSVMLFKYFFENAMNICSDKQSEATVYSYTADYQYKDAFVADKMVNNMGYLTDLIAECKFK